MFCKYGLKRRKARRFLVTVTNESLIKRREKHEQERADGLSSPAGSIERGMRLIWMREVRTLIRERGL